MNAHGHRHRAAADRQRSVPHEQAPIFHAAAETEKFRALAEVPLWTQDKPIGALTVYYAEPHAFTPNEIEELTAFANQAAVAVANARLYARTDQA